MNNIIENILICLSTLLLTILGVTIFSVIINYSFRFLGLKAEQHSLKLQKRITNKYSIIFLELGNLFILILMFSIVLIKSNYVLITLFIYMLYAVYTADLSRYLRNHYSDFPSIVKTINNKTNERYRKNYFISRLNIFMNQLHTMLALFVITFITLTFIFKLSWPVLIYYSVYFLIPLYVNIWVYFDYKDNEALNVRRITAYAVVLIYVFIDSSWRITDFYMGVNSRDNINHFSLYIISFVFIGIERLFKSIIDDYISFKKAKVT